MARLLFQVAETFEINGRGLVLLPGIIPVGDERFRVGDPIRLKRPDGKEEDYPIGGLEMCTPRRVADVALLLTNVTKVEVPIGSEVWSVDSQSQ